MQSHIPNAHQLLALLQPRLLAGLVLALLFFQLLPHRRRRGLARCSRVRCGLGGGRQALLQLDHARAGGVEGSHVRVGGGLQLLQAATAEAIRESARTSR